MGKRTRIDTVCIYIELAILSAILTGCIVVPHSVDANIEVYEEVKLSDDILVSTGPRRLLENVTKRIANLDRNITIVNGQTFLDTAFPQSSSKLVTLIGAPEHRSTVAETLSVDYLVLLGPAKLGNTTDEKGGVIWPLGAAKGTETSTLSAVVIDLTSGQPLSQLVVTASGSYHMLVYVYFAGTDPRTESAVVNSLGAAIVETVRKDSDDIELSLALLAAESMEDPFQITAAVQSPELYAGLEMRDRRFHEAGAAVPFTGLRNVFYPNGRRAAELEFYDGLEHGRYTTWDIDGSKEREVHYAEGKLNGADTQWYKYGSKNSERHYKSGEPHGLWTFWGPDGSISQQICYQHGNPVNVAAEDCQ